MNYVDRIFDEFEELDSRCEKLCKFIKGKVFKKLPKKQQEAMEVQLDYMIHYAEALMYRIICECAEDEEKGFIAKIFHGLINTKVSEEERIPIRIKAYDLVTTLIEARKGENNHD